LAEGYGNFAAEMYYNISPKAKYMELWLPIIKAEDSSEYTSRWNKSG
jgi:hypothetical protein